MDAVTVKMPERLTLELPVGTAKPAVVQPDGQAMPGENTSNQPCPITEDSAATSLSMALPEGRQLAYEAAVQEGTSPPWVISEATA
jgi:hypothetical protein